MSEANYNPLPVAEASEANGENTKYHTFINLALVLAAITGVELVLVYLPSPPFHPLLITATLIALSVFKFFAVMAWFMHLIYDRLILTLVFGAGLSIAGGTVVALMFIMDSGFVDFDAITAF